MRTPTYNETMELSAYRNKVVTTMSETAFRAVCSDGKLDADAARTEWVNAVRNSMVLATSEPDEVPVNSQYIISLVKSLNVTWTAIVTNAEIAMMNLPWSDNAVLHDTLPHIHNVVLKPLALQILESEEDEDYWDIVNSPIGDGVALLLLALYARLQQ